MIDYLPLEVYIDLGGGGGAVKWPLLGEGGGGRDPPLPDVGGSGGGPPE